MRRATLASELLRERPAADALDTSRTQHEPTRAERLHDPQVCLSAQLLDDYVPSAERLDDRRLRMTCVRRNALAAKE